MLTFFCFEESQRILLLLWGGAVLRCSWQGGRLPLHHLGLWLRWMPGTLRPWAAQSREVLVLADL